MLNHPGELYFSAFINTSLIFALVYSRKGTHIGCLLAVDIPGVDIVLIGTSGIFIQRLLNSQKLYHDIKATENLDWLQEDIFLNISWFDYLHTWIYSLIFPTSTIGSKFIHRFA